MADLEPLSSLVERKLHKAFPDPAQAQEARQLLNLYGSQHWEREPDRVRLAIIKLSSGNLSKLSGFVKVASSDYRDVLAWAEYPDQMKTLKPDAVAVERDRIQYEAWLRE